MKSFLYLHLRVYERNRNFAFGLQCQRILRTNRRWFVFFLLKNIQFNKENLTSRVRRINRYPFYRVGGFNIYYSAYTYKFNTVGDYKVLLIFEINSDTGRNPRLIIINTGKLYVIN